MGDKEEEVGREVVREEVRDVDVELESNGASDLEAPMRSLTTSSSIGLRVVVLIAEG